MDDGLSRLEARVEEIADRVAAIERRLAGLEARGPVPAARASAAAPGEDDLPGVHMADLGTVAALVGRTLFVLAGAYLLRALTDSGRLPAGPGVLLGLAFALTWIVMADLAGARRRSASAAFHGTAFVLIAFPLLFEATTRFRFLPAGTAALGLGGSAAVALVVGARRRLAGVTWIATFGALFTAVALMLATERVGPFAPLLVALGVATLWLGYVLGWTVLRWPVALVADLAVLVLSWRAVLAASADGPGAALAVQVLLLVSYLGSFAARTLWLGRDVVPFEVAQSIGAIAVGVGGAAYVTHMTGVGALPLGLATLALAAGCYGAAVVFIERRQGRRRNFYFYTSAGLVLALAGCALALPAPAPGLAYAALGLTAAWAGRLSGRITFQAHGAAYVAAAVVASGLLPHVVHGLGLPVEPRGSVSAAMLGVLALGGATIPGLGPGAAEGPPSPARRVPRLCVLVLELGGLLGVAVALFLPPASGAAPAAAEPGLVATVRTGLLVAGILLLAWADRAVGLVEGAWLVYPLLVLTGLKFLLEDFRAGQAATLFVGFALYGLALVVGPRLCRRPGGPARPEAP